MGQLVDDYNNAQEEYCATWAVTDKILYKLCRGWRSQSKADIHAKLVLIGRGYQTNVEKTVVSPAIVKKRRQGYALDRLAAGLSQGEQRRELNRILGSLAPVCFPVTAADHGAIQKAHRDLVRLIRTSAVVGPSRSRPKPRSFAAKFLHFHCPAVPIYDRYARRGLRPFANCRLTDVHDYARFLTHFWKLYERLPVRLRTRDDSVRILDRVLVRAANGL